MCWLIFRHCFVILIDYFSMLRYAFLRKKNDIFNSVLLTCNTTLLSWNTPRKGHLRNVEVNQMLPEVTGGNKPFEKEEHLNDKALQSQSNSFENETEFPDFESFLNESPETSFLKDVVEENAVVVGGLRNKCSLREGNCPNESYLHSNRTCAQNVQGSSSSVKFESVVDRMMEFQINACCIQETWALGNWMKSVNNYCVFHHNYDAKQNSEGRNAGGVALILSPHCVKAWTLAGSKPPICMDDNFCRRFIGLTLKFKNRNYKNKKN